MRVNRPLFHQGSLAAEGGVEAVEKAKDGKERGGPGRTATRLRTRRNMVTDLRQSCHADGDEAAKRLEGLPLLDARPDLPSAGGFPRRSLAGWITLPWEEFQEQRQDTNGGLATLPSGNTHITNRYTSA